MNRFESRTAAAYRALTPAERASVVLDMVRRDEEVDPFLLMTMPAEDGHEFGSLLGLLGRATSELGGLIRQQGALIGALDRLTAHIGELEDGDAVVSGALALLAMGIPEPIGPAESELRIAEAATEKLPLREATALADEMGMEREAARVAIKTASRSGTVSFGQICEMTATRTSARPGWGAATIIVPDPGSVEDFARCRDALRDHLVILRSWTASERTNTLRQHARTELSARQTDFDVITAALHGLEEHFAGMVPLFDEDQELLAGISERLQKLTELLGPADAGSPTDAAKHLVRALTSGNGLA